MIDDDQPHNRGDPNVDKITQREVKAGLKVLHNQGNKFKVEKVDHQAFHQRIFAGLFRGEQYIRQMHRLFAEKDDQYQAKAQQTEVQHGLEDS